MTTDGVLMILTPDQAVDSLAQAAERGDDVWEAACEQGRQARTDADGGRRRLGDLAITIRKHYGQNGLGAFAEEVGAARSTIKQYRNFARFYPKDTYVSFLSKHPALAYSHLREAMRLKDLDQALTFLDTAWDADPDKPWTVERLTVEVTKRLGKPVPPKTLLDGEAILAVAGDGRILFKADADIVQTAKALLASGPLAVKLKIIEVRE